MEIKLAGAPSGEATRDEIVLGVDEFRDEGDLFVGVFAEDGFDERGPEPGCRIRCL